MKVRLVFVRNGTAQYSNNDYVMEKQCKTVDVELPIRELKTQGLA